MKLNKSLLAITAVSALFASSVFAAPLLSPRAAESAPKVVVSDEKNVSNVSSSTFTGSGVKAKYAGNRVVASTKADPNLLACAAIGKATCDMKPCDGKMVAACCKK